MPIAMSKDEWSRIARWTDQDREDPDVLRRREYVRYLDASSKEMTKHWPNSLENVNKRSEELRLARIEAAEKANSKFYKRYLKRQKDEQERLMYSARDIVFKNKDGPKLLLSAVIETCIQKERQEQVKFLEELRRQAAVQKRKDDDEIIRKAKEWEQLVQTKKKRRFDVNKKHQEEIIDQIHEISERNRKEYEDELRMQKLDNIQADQQNEALKEFEENFRAEDKARIWADMDQAKRESRARRAEQAARDRLDDRLMEVLVRSRARVDKQRKQTEIDVKAEKQRVLDQISAKLESGDAAREAKDQAILDKAIKEKDDIAAAARSAQAARAAALREERAAARRQHLRDEERRLHEFNNMRQWECMNRFKNLELYEEYKEKQRKEVERKTEEFREDTLRLWKEREDSEARQLAESRYFHGALADQKLRDAHAQLLAHAAALLREAEEHHRPAHALHIAIHRYCKMHRLYPMPPLPASLAEHFRLHALRDAQHAPRAGSQPDKQHGPAGAGGAAGNGLDDPVQPTTSKASNKKQKEESVADYKRASRAEGLQRRAGQYDVTLPPITVVPCRTEDCSCDLNK